MNCCCKLDTRRFFILGMRLMFGIWLLYAGVFKWIAIGPTGFADMIAEMFKETWSPRPLNIALAYVIIIAEPVLAALLLVGKRQRCVWTLITALMFMLTLGQSLLMKPDVIANWTYTVLALVCAAMSDCGQSKCQTTTPPQAC
jgi:uncharacterized membrane protein YphA (DoxX/SURF4 family)